MPILIKRYANRKLYNTASSRYITLKGISQLLDEGEEVRVIDNETGEDITSVALSQILVDSTRSKGDPSPSLLTQIMERGGDVLYDVLKRGVGDASDNLDEIQERFRRIIGADSEGRRHSDRVDRGERSERGERSDRGQKSERGEHDEHETRRESSGRRTRGTRRGLGDWIAYASPDFDSAIQNAVERVFKVLDLPRRKDVDALNENLERVARALEHLQDRIARSEAQRDEAPDRSEEAPSY